MLGFLLPCYVSLLLELRSRHEFLEQLQARRQQERWPDPATAPPQPMCAGPWTSPVCRHPVGPLALHRACKQLVWEQLGIALNARGCMAGCEVCSLQLPASWPRQLRVCRGFRPRMPLALCGPLHPARFCQMTCCLLAGVMHVMQAHRTKAIPAKLAMAVTADIGSLAAC
jgi:hypothetical protein